MQVTGYSELSNKNRECSFREHSLKDIGNVFNKTEFVIEKSSIIVIPDISERRTVICAELSDLWEKEPARTFL